MFFVFFSEKTTCATYITNWLVFITEIRSVYCAVRTLSLDKAGNSGVPRGGSTPTPEILKILVESSIAWARRTGVSISFCSSLCSHTAVIYWIKDSFNTNCLAVAYLVSEFKPNPTSRKFDRVEPDCKLSRKCLVFLFQHPN